MAYTQLYYPPTTNALQKSLGAALDQGTTSSMTLNNVTGIQDKPGVVLINRIDTNDTELSASVREFVVYTGVSGSTLTGLTRGVGGTSDQDHAVGSVVEFISDITFAQALIDFLLVEHLEADGTHGAVTATSVNIGSTIAITGTLDEDNMATNSAVKLATQQSIKAYVDSGTTTLTNKRITRRVVAVTQAAEPTINTDNTDVAYITGLAQAITSMTTNLSGTPVNGDSLIVSITDDGTGRAITWGAKFEASGTISLPTTTVASTRLDVGFLWNTATSKWRIAGIS